jgi:hypothetical protein
MFNGQFDFFAVGGFNQGLILVAAAVKNNDPISGLEPQDGAYMMRIQTGQLGLIL